MGATNPFSIILIVTAFMLVASGVFAVAAPAFNISVPKAPVFPTLNELNVQGNLSATFPFSETHDVTAYNTVKFAAFSPDKQVLCRSGFVTLQGTGDGFQVQRYASFFIIPYWVNEPVMNQNGVDLNQGVMLVQSIVDDFNGSYSTYTVDNGNNQYQCMISFSPLAGYSDMVSSWNVGHGFSVWMYGSAYASPTWTDQLVAYLTFAGAIIAYFVYFLAYMVSMAAALITVLTSPVLGSAAAGVGVAVIVLVVIAFIGSLLMFIRGIGVGK